MSIAALFVRFVLYYAGLAFIVETIVHHFELGRSAAVNVGILMVMILLLCWDYIQANKRFLSGREKRRVAAGLIIINLALQMALFWNALASIGQPIDIRAFLIALGFVAVFHSIAIVAFLNLGEKLNVNRTTAWNVTGILKPRVR